MAEETVLPIPNLQLAQHAWLLKQPSLKEHHSEARQALLKGIDADDMAPFLATLISTGVLSADDSEIAQLLETCKSRNENKFQEIQKLHDEAVEKEGETEIADALRSKAVYLARIGEKEKAIEAYETALTKFAGLPSKIDLRLSIVRIAFFHFDLRLVATSLEKAKELIDKGGDWDRRNRLKVYQGVHACSVRDFATASENLLDTLPTFTATELIKYEDFVGLCIIVGVLCLSRKDLKKKIIESPEVLASLPDLPHLKDFTTALYHSQYAKFFRSLAEVEEHHLQPSAILAAHTRYYIREMRIKAYAQFLESYRSVTLASLSQAFGVSPDWLDADLARFIAQGRLNFTIDKVNGVIETSRPDQKNARYEAVIKSSDALLNSIQRLSRVIG